MNHRYLITAVFGFLLLCPAAPASMAATAKASLEIKDLLEISSKKELVELTLVKIEALARLLSRVTDEASACDLRPAIERSYLEMELVGTRLGMMGPATAADRAQVADTQQRYTTAMQTVQREIGRIAANKSMASPLLGVTWPLHGQIADNLVAKTNSLISQLQTLRSQIELYKLMHRDNLPDFRRNGWKQLTEKTQADGTIGSGPCGPYLQSPPPNALNGSAKMLLVGGKPKAGFRYDKGDAGWVINEKTGEVWALDAEGKILDDSTALRSAAAE